MKKEKKEDVYELVKKDYAKTSIFYPPGSYDPLMNKYLIVWLLESSQGGLSLKDINATFEDFQKVIRETTKTDFYPDLVISRNSNRDTALDYNGQWYYLHDALEELCGDGYLEQGMPIYQTTEKGRLELGKWQKAIADFLIKCDAETIEQIIKNLLKGKNIFERQNIKYIVRPESRDPY